MLFCVVPSAKVKDAPEHTSKLALVVMMELMVIKVVTTESHPAAVSRLETCDSLVVMLLDTVPSGKV